MNFDPNTITTTSKYHSITSCGSTKYNNSNTMNNSANNNMIINKNLLNIADKGAAELIKTLPVHAQNSSFLIQQAALVAAMQQQQQMQQFLVKHIGALSHLNHNGILPPNYNNNFNLLENNFRAAQSFLPQLPPPPPALSIKNEVPTSVNGIVTNSNINHNAVKRKKNTDGMAGKNRKLENASVSTASIINNFSKDPYNFDQTITLSNGAASSNHGFFNQYSSTSPSNADTNETRSSSPISPSTLEKYLQTINNVAIIGPKPPKQKVINVVSTINPANPLATTIVEELSLNNKETLVNKCSSSISTSPVDKKTVLPLSLPSSCLSTPLSIPNPCSHDIDVKGPLTSCLKDIPVIPKPEILNNNAFDQKQANAVMKKLVYGIEELTTSKICTTVFTPTTSLFSTANLILKNSNITTTVVQQSCISSIIPTTIEPSISIKNEVIEATKEKQMDKSVVVLTKTNPLPLTISDNKGLSSQNTNVTTAQSSTQKVIDNESSVSRGVIVTSCDTPNSQVTNSSANNVNSLQLSTAFSNINTNLTTASKKPTAPKVRRNSSHNTFSAGAKIKPLTALANLKPLMQIATHQPAPQYLYYSPGTNQFYQHIPTSFGCPGAGTVGGAAPLVFPSGNLAAAPSYFVMAPPPHPSLQQQQSHQTPTIHSFIPAAAPLGVSLPTCSQQDFNSFGSTTSNTFNATISNSLPSTTQNLITPRGALGISCTPIIGSKPEISDDTFDVMTTKLPAEDSIYDIGENVLLHIIEGNIIKESEYPLPLNNGFKKRFVKSAGLQTNKKSLKQTHGDKLDQCTSSSQNLSKDNFDEITLISLATTKTRGNGKNNSLLNTREETNVSKSALPTGKSQQTILGPLPCTNSNLNVALSDKDSLMASNLKFSNLSCTTIAHVSPLLQAAEIPYHNTNFRNVNTNTQLTDSEQILLHKRIQEWTVSDVYDFILNVSGCKNTADIFKNNEIDGAALALLKEEHFLTSLHLKLGPALKIQAKVAQLIKKQGNV